MSTFQKTQYLKIPGLDISERKKRKKKKCLQIPGFNISENAVSEDSGSRHFRKKKRRKKKCLKIPGFNISENAVIMWAALLVLAFGAAVALDDHGGSLGDFLLFYSFIYVFIII